MTNEQVSDRESPSFTGCKQSKRVYMSVHIGIQPVPYAFGIILTPFGYFYHQISIIIIVQIISQGSISVYFFVRIL